MTNEQRKCVHIFLGKEDGVHCTRCGLHLTATQYHELLHPPKPKEKSEAERKTNQPRKKKETVTNE